MRLTSLRLLVVIVAMPVIAEADQVQEEVSQRLQSPGAAPLVEVHSKRTVDGYKVDVLVREPSNGESNGMVHQAESVKGTTNGSSRTNDRWRPVANAISDSRIQSAHPKTYAPARRSSNDCSSSVRLASQEHSVPVPPAEPNEVGQFEVELPIPREGTSTETASSMAAESLEQAFATAISQNQTLEATRRLSAASGYEWEAAKADRWSNTALRAAYGYRNRQQGLEVPAVPLPGFPTSIPTQQRDIARVGVYWEQPVWTFGRIGNSIDAAGARTIMASADERVVEQEVKLKVALAYVSVLRAKQLMAVEQSEVQSLEEHARNVRQRLEQGLVVRNDLLAVQTEVLNAKQALLEAENTLSTASAAYNQALSRPLDYPVNLQSLELPKGAAENGELTQFALQQRAEFTKLGAESHALHHQAESTRAERLPQVSVQASYEYTQNQFATFQDIGAVALVADWNVFDSGRRQNRASHFQESAAGVSRRRTDLESEVALQIHETRQNLLTALKRVEVNRESLQSADENHAISANRYREGTVTNSVVLDAVALQTAAYGRYHNSVFDAVLADLRLKRAIGAL